MTMNPNNFGRNFSSNANRSKTNNRNTYIDNNIREHYYDNSDSYNSNHNDNRSNSQKKARTNTYDTYTTRESHDTYDTNGLAGVSSSNVGEALREGQRTPVSMPNESYGAGRGMQHEQQQQKHPQHQGHYARDASTFHQLSYPQSTNPQQQQQNQQRLQYSGSQNYTQPQQTFNSHLTRHLTRPNHLAITSTAEVTTRGLHERGSIDVRSRDTSNRTPQGWDTFGHNSNMHRNMTPFGPSGNGALLLDHIPRKKSGGSKTNEWQYNNQSVTTLATSNSPYDANVKSKIPMNLDFEKWKSYSFEERYKLILPDENPFRFPELLPPPDYEQRKLKAVEETLQYLQLKWKVEQDDDPVDDDDDESKNSSSNGSDDDCLFKDVKGSTSSKRDQRMAEIQSNIEKYATFVRALPHCTPLDLGYLSVVYFVDADEFCWCPCAENKFWRWRQAFGVDEDLHCKCSAKSQKYRPHGLRQHLRSNMSTTTSSSNRLLVQDKRTILHDLLYIYLDHVYNNYTYLPDQDIWLHHKGHYDPLSKEFKTAEAAENKELSSKLKQLTKQLLDEQNRIQEYTVKLQQLEMTNMAKAQLLREKEATEKIWRIKLGIEESSSQQQRKICNEQKQLHFEILQDYITLTQSKLKKTLKVSGMSSAARRALNAPVNVTVAHNFDLSTMLTKWTLSSDDDDPFAELNSDNQCKLLNDFDVTFAASTDRGQDVAVDEGGPSRAFFSTVWRQIREVQGTRPKDGYRFDLFTDDIDYCIPQKNEIIEYKLFHKKLHTEKFQEGCNSQEAFGLVRPFYRILGKILLLNIRKAVEVSTNSTNRFGASFVIGSHVVPRLYRYYLFKGLGPMDERYPLSDLYKDVIDLKYPQNKVKSAERSQMDVMQEYSDLVGETDHDCTIQNFRKAAQNDLIVSRSWALDSMKEGLSLGGNINLESRFLVIPMPYIDAMLFGKQDVLADDLISVLVPDYQCDQLVDGKVEELEQAIDAMALILRIEQNIDGKDQRCGFLPDILRKREKEGNSSFASQFAEFSTGSSYIPQHDPNFKITIEFNFIESEKYDWLPISHTCNNTVKLPGLAYHGDRELFEKQLEKSIEYSKDVGFDIA